MDSDFQCFKFFAYFRVILPHGAEVAGESFGFRPVAGAVDESAAHPFRLGMSMDDLPSDMLRRVPDCFVALDSLRFI